MMNSVHQGVGPGCPTWSKGPWQDKSLWWSVLVSHVPSLPSTVVCTQIDLSFSLLGLQVKAGMGRCGGAPGWGRMWPSRSSLQGMNNPGSERRRSTTQCSSDMTTYWVREQMSVSVRF